MRRLGIGARAGALNQPTLYACLASPFSDSGFWCWVASSPPCPGPQLLARSEGKALSRARFIDPQVTGAFNPAGIAVSLASATHGNRAGVIRREGPAWLMYLGAATALYPIDRLSGSPGIINYVAMKNGHPAGEQAASA